MIDIISKRKILLTIDKSHAFQSMMIAPKVLIPPVIKELAIVMRQTLTGLEHGFGLPFMDARVPCVSQRIVKFHF